MPPEDRVRPADTEPLGGVSASTSVAGSSAEDVVGGPVDEISAPSIPDPMSRAEAARATQPVSVPEPPASPDSPYSPASPPSPESPSSPDSPPDLR